MSTPPKICDDALPMLQYVHGMMHNRRKNGDVGAKLAVFNLHVMSCPQCTEAWGAKMSPLIAGMVRELISDATS